MIIISVILLSARDGSATELARMHISNVGGTHARRDYDVQVLRGRSTEAFSKRTVQADTTVSNWPAPAVHVWNLVVTALSRMGYGDKR